jgi:hypothetical protein
VEALKGFGLGWNELQRAHAETVARSQKSQELLEIAQLASIEKNQTVKLLRASPLG